MKKHLAIFLVFLLAFLLPSCSIFDSLAQYGVSLAVNNWLHPQTAASAANRIKTYIIFQAEDPGAADIRRKMETAKDVVRKRLDGTAYTDATVKLLEDNRLRVEATNVKDLDGLILYLSAPAVLQLVDPDGNIVLTGDHIKTAEAAIYNSANVVNFTLDEQGTQDFAEATKRLVGQTIKIVLDGVTISEPVVNTAITGGSGYIESNYTVEQALALAKQLMSGSLPVKLIKTETGLVQGP